MKDATEMFDFDQPVARESTSSVKFDRREAVFGTADVLPLWVADMDFAAPPAVTRALIERASHPVYGYSFFPEGLYRTMIDWFGRRHGWHIERDWVMIAPGVVPSLHAACMAFAAPGESVIIQSPVYPPFFAAAGKTGRRLLENPLYVRDGTYRMDLDHLRTCAMQDARVLLLCSPHNPVGRVWTTEELSAVLEIAREFGLVVFSDDIHCDLVFSGHRHQMLAQLAQPGDRVITAVAPSKTFNVPGMGLSALVAADAGDRRALQLAFDRMHMEQANPFSLTAFEAAYRHGEAWLDALLRYLEDNARMVCEFIAERIPLITTRMPEATYLMWLDCSSLQMSDSQLKTFFTREARLGLNPGLSFGPTGSGFMRLNIGTRRALLRQALEQLSEAVNRQGQTG